MKANTGDLLLRKALRLNAVFSAVSGLSLAAGSYVIGPRIGVEPSWIVLAVGAGLLPFAFDLFVNASRSKVDLSKVKTAIAGDIAWVAGSIAVIVADPTGLTTAGIVTIALVAAVLATLRSFSSSATDGRRLRMLRMPRDRPRPKWSSGVVRSVRLRASTL